VRTLENDNEQFGRKIPSPPLDLNGDGRRYRRGLTCNDRLLQERTHEVLERSDAANIGRKAVELLGEVRAVKVKELREGVEDSKRLRFRNHGTFEEYTELEEQKKSPVSLRS